MIPEDLTDGIVQILRYDGIFVGTGFLVSNNLIATCAHVVQAAEMGPGNKVKVRFYPNGKESDAIVMPEKWYSPDKEDLSLLQLEDELPSDVKALSLGSSAGVTGHKVCTFGFPSVGDIKGIWGHGEVLGKVTEKGNSLLQVDSNEITAGFSGAPLWDESRNRVIGIIVGTVKKDSFDKLQNVAFSIPSEILQSICPELKINDICPYRGLSSFKEGDEYLFFGREKLVLELKTQLQTYPRFLAVVGSSGSGKSSLVFAGLLPLIKRGRIIGFENVQVVTFRPNDISKSDNVCDSDPDESLRQALQKSGISIEENDLWKGISSYLEKKPEVRLVIYADQFETLFSNVDKAKQVEFLQGIYDTVRSKLKVSFLLTIRGDYYNFLLSSMLGEFLRGGQVNVRSMLEEEMRDAIKKPANITGLKIETGLENLIITHLKNTKNPLPLLEFTLTQLWNHRSNGMLTHKSYLEIGGATGAIGQWANETYNSLNTEEKELARKIFTRLIYCREGDFPDSRLRLPLDKLAGSSDKQSIRQLIKKLADAHLLVTGCELSKKAQTVEIIHDALLIEWKQLKNWINEQRSFLTWRQRLEDKMNEWNNSKKDEGSLLRGAPLVVAKDWLEKYKDELDPEERKYIDASSELEEKNKAEKELARAQREKTQKDIIIGLTFFCLIILILAGFAAYQWYQADQQKQIADEKTKEVRVSYLNIQSKDFIEDAKNLDKGILLAIESFRILRTSEADQLIRQGLLFIPLNVEILNHSNKVTDFTFSPDGKYIATASDDGTAHIWDASEGKEIAHINHTKSVRNVKFSSDGKYVATASRDNTARIWDAATGKQIVLNHNDSVAKVFFSPNRKYIATMTYGNMAYLWNLSTGENIATLNHSDNINQIVFSSDGKHVATASNDKTVRLWDAFTGEYINSINHSNKVLDVAFSPDGKQIVTASWDKTACVWNVTTGKQFPLKHDYPLIKVLFSPDGKYIATMSNNSAAYLWNASTGEQIDPLNHSDMVHDIAFSPDGKQIATASYDYTARILNIVTGVKITLKHDFRVNKALFSPDGKYIATASNDETARLWDASTGKQIAVMNHCSGVTNIMFSPDGKYIATVIDEKVYLWDTSTEIPILYHNDSVFSIAFSRDGGYVATASWDKTARVWDASTGKQIAAMNHSDKVNKIVFSPGGKYIATASDDKTARVWDASTGKNITLNHDDRVNNVVFSPDGKYIATASNDKTACVWDVSTGKQFPLNHDDSVLSVAFSPDGNYIATASRDGTAHVWSASTGKNITFMKHNDKINKIIFSPDGKYVATASYDETARVWNASTGENITSINHSNKVLDVAFSPDGKQIATASWDKTARISNIFTNENITLKHDDYVSRVMFSPDGRYIATANYGRTAFLWNASTGEQITALSHDGVVNDIAFSPDGKHIATASGDCTARIWVYDIDNLINETSHCLTRNLTPEEWKKYMGNESYHKTFQNLP